MTPSPIKSSISAADRIFIALDVDSESDAHGIVEECRSFGVGFKIGLQLFTNAGPRFVSQLADAGHRVFLDLKFHDIPNTVAKASVEAARLGVWMFNLHALGGGEMMKRSVDEVNEAVERETVVRPRIIAVTILTSFDGVMLNEIGVTVPIGEQVTKLSTLAAASGMDGVVASAREARGIRQAVRSDFLIVSPGIRPANATIDDQKRVTTPADAIAAGADYLVIGRPITGVADKATELEKILKEIDNSSR